MASVTVCGSASASVAPDRAIVGLSLTRVEPTARAALDEVARRSTQLESLLGELAIERQDWVTDGVTVAEEWQWANDTNTLIGQRATAGVTVTVHDLSTIGELIGEAVARCGASMRELSWKVDAGNPARRSLLGEAAVDARLRASAYVDALGLRLGAVELVSELAPEVAQPSPLMVTSMRAMKVADGGAEMATSGGQVELNASVFVRFAILPST